MYRYISHTLYIDICMGPHTCTNKLIQHKHKNKHMDTIKVILLFEITLYLYIFQNEILGKTIILLPIGLFN